MQQLKWNLMIPQPSATSSSNLVNGTSSGSSNNTSDQAGQVGVVGSQLERGKNVSQMSLQEILASSEYQSQLLMFSPANSVGL